jgi:hypothetical protein
MLVAKTALFGVQLVGRDPQIEHNAIYLPDSQFRQHFRQLAKWTVHQMHPRCLIDIPQPLSRRRNRRWVPVQTHQAPLSTQLLQYQRGVPAAPHGAIHTDPAGLGRQKTQDLIRHDRLMAKRHFYHQPLG